MLRQLSPVRARIAIALMLALCAWSLTIRPAPPSEVILDRGYSDVQLQQDAAAAVASGESFHHAIVDLQRKHDYPLRPFFAVRMPTLVMLGAWFGWGALRVVLGGILVACALAWTRALRDEASPAERTAALLLVLAGGAMVAVASLVTQHELWAGVLIALAFALRLRGNWLAALACGALALAIRELALGFVGLAAIFALAERRWKELAGWAVVVAFFAAGLWLHAREVNALLLPDDIALTGWAIRGPSAPLRDLVDASLLGMAPRPLAYMLALLPLLGWLAAPIRVARFALPLYLGYALMLAVFARPQNFYWGIMLMPAYFVGVAFLPRLVSDLRHATLARRQAPL